MLDMDLVEFVQKRVMDEIYWYISYTNPTDQRLVNLFLENRRNIFVSFEGFIGLGKRNEEEFFTPKSSKPYSI